MIDGLSNQAGQTAPTKPLKEPKKLKKRLFLRLKNVFKVRRDYFSWGTIRSVLPFVDNKIEALNDSQSTLFGLHRHSK